MQAAAAAADGVIAAPPELVTDLAHLLGSAAAQPALDKLLGPGGRLAGLAPPYNRAARCAELRKLAGASQQVGLASWSLCFHPLHQSRGCRWRGNRPGRPWSAALLLHANAAAMS